MGSCPLRGLQGKALKQGLSPTSHCWRWLHSHATGHRCPWKAIWTPSRTRACRPRCYLDNHPEGPRMAFCVGIFLLCSRRKRLGGDIGTKHYRESKTGLSSALLSATSLPCRSQGLHTATAGWIWRLTSFEDGLSKRSFISSPHNFLCLGWVHRTKGLFTVASQWDDTVMQIVLLSATRCWQSLHSPIQVMIRPFSFNSTNMNSQFGGAICVSLISCHTKPQNCNIEATLANKVFIKELIGCRFVHVSVYEIFWCPYL